MTSPFQTELSVVLPAFGAARLLTENVPHLVDYLESLGIDFEIIIADDGSDDAGATRRTASDLGVRYVANPRNMGKGAAVRRGMRASRGRFRIYTDADIPYELPAIESMLVALESDHAGVVTGDRTLAESAYYSRITPTRKIASLVFSNVVGALLGTNQYDTQCGLKGFRAEVADDLFSVARISRFAFDVELFYIALRRGYGITRLPVELRHNEVSTVNLLGDGLSMIRDLVVIRWHQFRGRYRQRDREVPQRNDSGDA